MFNVQCSMFNIQPPLPAHIEHSVIRLLIEHWKLNIEHLAVGSRFHGTICPSYLSIFSVILHLCKLRGRDRIRLDKEDMIALGGNRNDSTKTKTDTVRDPEFRRDVLTAPCQSASSRPGSLRSRQEGPAVGVRALFIGVAGANGYDLAWRSRGLLPSPTGSLSPQPLDEFVLADHFHAKRLRLVSL
jgi:hypothetical protein